MAELKGQMSEMYTKAEVDEHMSGMYTKAEVDEMIQTMHLGIVSSLGVATCSSGSYDSNGFAAQYIPFSGGMQTTAACPSGSTGSITLQCSSDGSTVTLVSGQCQRCSDIDFSGVDSVVDGSCTACTAVSGPTNCTAATCVEGHTAYTAQTGACSRATGAMACSSGTLIVSGSSVSHTSIAHGADSLNQTCTSSGYYGTVDLACADGVVSLLGGTCTACGNGGPGGYACGQGEYKTGTACSGTGEDTQTCAACGNGGVSFTCPDGYYQDGACDGTGTEDTQTCAGLVIQNFNDLETHLYNCVNEASDGSCTNYLAFDNGVGGVYGPINGWDVSRVTEMTYCE